MSPSTSCDGRSGRVGRARAVAVPRPAVAFTAGAKGRARAVSRARAAVGAVLGVLAVSLCLAVPAQAVPGPPASSSPPPQGAYVLADFTAAPDATDFGHRTTTLSGTLLQQDPAGGPDGPAAGQTVDLVASAGSDDPLDGSGSGAFDPMGTVTTGADGRFELADAVVELRADRTQAPVPGPYAVTVYALRRVDPAAYGGWDTEARLTVTATPSTGRLTMDYVLGPPGAWGRTVTAHGVFERLADDAWLPVRGVTVRVDYGSGDRPPLHREVLTDPDGRFSVTLTVTADGTVTTSADWSADPYLDLTGPDGSERAVVVPPPAPTATTPGPKPASPTQVPTTRPTRQAAAVPAVSHSPAARRTERAPARTSAGRRTAEPDRLAETGEGSSRAAFLTGGSTLVAAGLLLVVVRRRLRGIG